ncbi:glycosyltransferase family 2 protein [Acinetobacter puyangensis]|uniref:dTDP-glucose pyrophosphorylase n=1 Tax=Acinetobacter puyangensis TaxID=1096779 RepID=A0A240E5Q1_9GAMM|nr:capsular biosynthesis protein [Acinetobacter puyangensis]SNX43851.1 hypothetical protein SAMN05421731_1027 [Acinetobacter puyangensis]
MFVIPMAGLSSRFFKAGYTVPKYMLELNDITIFEWSVLSFKKYFQSDKFVFILFDHYDTPNFVKEKIIKLGIINYQIIILNKYTLGQADTVYQGIKDIEEDEIYVFNIDSRLNNFEKLPFQVDGYLEVFKGEGEHWSFVLPGENNTVLRTTEKQRISDLCSNGLYYFASLEKYKKYFTEELKCFGNNEIYIAPIYNKYIDNGENIKYKIVELKDIDFCGTPIEYLETLKKYNKEGL